MSFPRRVLLAFVTSMIAAACSHEEGPDYASDSLSQVAQVDAGVTDAAAVSVVTGTATTGKCFSYTKADAGMCAGYFCGVNEAQLTASMPTSSICPLPSEICQGTLSGAVAACTRTIVIANLGKPVDPLKPQIQECVYKDANLKEKVSPTCLGCYLTVASCAASQCLVECLSDSPNCDTCRKKNNCDVPVFGCAQIPSPF